MTNFAKIARATGHLRPSRKPFSGSASNRNHSQPEEFASPRRGLTGSDGNGPKGPGSQEGGKPHLCPGLTFRTTSNGQRALPDRKSTRLNSSHLVISYALFCLKNTTALQFRVEHAIAPLLGDTVFVALTFY